MEVASVAFTVGPVLTLEKLVCPVPFKAPGTLPQPCKARGEKDPGSQHGPYLVTAQGAAVYEEQPLLWDDLIYTERLTSHSPAAEGKQIVGRTKMVFSPL